MVGERDGAAGGVVSRLLWPAAGLYGIAVRCRNALYDHGVIGAARAALPVISVGNLVAGGTGKTPLVAWLGERLLSAGVACAILTRGYGRRESRPRHVGPGDSLPPWETIGDEPWLLARRLGGAAVGIDADRVRAAGLVSPLMRHGVLLLDDGFQHRRLGRDLNIVTLAARDPLGGGRLLPAGRLREPASGLTRADLVVITGTSLGFECGEGTRASAASVEVADPGPARRVVARYAPGAQVVEAGARWRGVVGIERMRERVVIVGRDGLSAGPRCKAMLAAPEDGLEDGDVPPADGPVVLISGIAHPDRFAETMVAAGYDVRDHVSRPDHHRFTVGDARRAIALARAVEAGWIVTTEKDAPRLAPVWPESEPLGVAMIDLAIMRGEQALLAAVSRVVGRELT